MKAKKSVKIIVGELIANLVSWFAGLLTAQLLSSFIAVRSWKNGWGLFSRKTTMDAQSFGILEWVVSAILGFAVMYLVNWLIKKYFINNNTEETSN